MTFEQFVSIVGTLGFPIVVALFVLMRLERDLRQLTRELQNLRESLGRVGPLPRRGSALDG